MENMEQEQQSEAQPEVGLTDQPEQQPSGDSPVQTEAPEPEFEIERNGQVVKVKHSEAKDYISKGYDYTQKTQELAKERDS